ncbi:MAG: DUF6273 domain-containing protein, partial [Synergistaceae bacterium]|nr:DUF6273 domain-containing protein [Synergistaceae bacterium]
RIFLLSLEEVARYFGDSGQLKKRPSSNTYYINDQYNSARIAKDASGNALWWWLRSPGNYSVLAASVHYDGLVFIIGDYVLLDHGGVRPALWINL